VAKVTEPVPSSQENDAPGTAKPRKVSTNSGKKPKADQVAQNDDQPQPKKTTRTRAVKSKPQLATDASQSGPEPVIKPKTQPKTEITEVEVGSDPANPTNGATASSTAPDSAVPSKTKEALNE
jgi:hypothetical protein